MPTVDPRVIIRMGTHAEKEYLEKTLKFFNGLILGANLVESTPGATASLMVKLCGSKSKQPYYIDPMTYAFGSYVDEKGKVRSDLDWIKSEQKRSGTVVRDFKRSYRGLAKAMGSPFSSAIEKKAAVTWRDFSDKAITSCCTRVAEYQYSRIADEFISDPELKDFADKIPRPAAILAPYFYIEPTRANEWLDLVLKLAGETASVEDRVPVHAVICVDSSFLSDATFVRRLVDEIPKTGVDGVWLWFSKLLEDQADVSTLTSLRSLVEELSENVEVYNMHGGYFSLALCKCGMSGISHGVGYGEQKDVLPVIGQSTPTVRYYLPDAYKRFGVPNIQRCFAALGIRTPDDFHEKICNCVICKGVVARNIADFSSFGDQHYSRAESKRMAQTPAAAKRCRFHFLLCRIRERDWLESADLDDVTEKIREATKKWGKQPSMSDDVGHLERWRKVLGTD